VSPFTFGDWLGRAASSNNAVERTRLRQLHPSLGKILRSRCPLHLRRSVSRLPRRCAPSLPRPAIFNIMIHFCCVLAILAIEGAAVPPVGVDTTSLFWSPPTPVEGSVIEFTLAPGIDLHEYAGDLTIVGEIANESLHFEFDGSGTYKALAPIPVGSPDTLSVELRVEGARNSESIVAKVPVARVRTGVLQLSVDPRFISPPESELPRIRAERDMVIAVSRRSHQTPRLWSESFLRPRSTRITANFGQRREFNGELRSLHMGVDLAGAVGTPVIASNRGVVVIVHDFYYAGTAIHLDHGFGLTTAYMHLSEVAVAVGDTVARGEVVGKVGSSGRVTGPHLHWHAKYGLLTVNPLTLLDVQQPQTAESGGRTR